MGSLGMQEIIIIFVLALIIFGPRKLPEIGKTLGKGLQEFKKASNELKRTWEEEVQLEKEKESVSSILKDTTAEINRAASDFTSEITKETEMATGTPELSDGIAEATSDTLEVSSEIAKETSEIAKEMQ